MYSNFNLKLRKRSSESLFDVGFPPNEEMTLKEIMLIVFIGICQ